MVPGVCLVPALMAVVIGHWSQDGKLHRDSPCSEEHLSWSPKGIWWSSWLHCSPLKAKQFWMHWTILVWQLTSTKHKNKNIVSCWKWPWPYDGLPSNTADAKWWIRVQREKIAKSFCFHTVSNAPRDMYSTIFEHNSQNICVEIPLFPERVT